MTDLVRVLDFVTFIWLTGWAYHGFRQIGRGTHSTVPFVLLVLWVFYALPLFLNVVAGLPDYARYRRLQVALADPASSVLYDLYVSSIPPLLNAFGRTATTRIVTILPEHRRLVLSGMALGLTTIPFLAVLGAPNPAIYLVYGQPLRALLSGGEMDYHQVVATSSLLAVVGVAAFLFLQQRDVLFKLFLLSPLVLTAVWLHGKRSIVALAALLLGLVLWQRGLLRGYRLVLTGGLVIVGFTVFSMAYQTVYRDVGGDAAGWYRNVRLDYGRDDVTKLSILALLDPERSVLEYPGQSLLFYATAYVPRRVWPSKPLPYAQYLTSAVYDATPRLWGFSFTTSWLEEALSNFGWLGFLVGPLLIAFVCRIGDRWQSRESQSLTIMVSSLLLLLHAIAFVPLIALWLFSVLHARRTAARIGLRQAARWSVPLAEIPS